ncbi:hypothetical protein ACEQ8H_008338 [Pleosporales sp. CAS-2024a]
MSSFKFPPPPPPPPKASSNDNQPSNQSQRGGFNNRARGHADGGRGRTPRGGSGGFGGYPRGGSGNARGRGGQRGGHQNNRGGPSQRGGSGPWQQPAMPAHGNTLNVPSDNPAWTFPNPLLPSPAPVDPNAFIQAMSFIATPAGAQSMAAFASHMANAGNTSYAQPPQYDQTQQSPRYSPVQQSGQKRKWDDRQNNKHAQSSSKPPRAKAAVAPAIPGFGFTLPTAPSSSAPAQSKKAQDNKKGKVRLGLTHYDDQSEESSGEEDVDEEAALGAKLKGGGYAFEHNGESISLQTAADIADWIKDRRRNFPTYQKAVEKAQARAEKRKNELAFIRRLRGKPPQSEAEHVEPVERVQKRSVMDEKEQEERIKANEKKQEELAALRKKLHESMVKKQEAPAAVDLGVGYGSATESDEESSVLSDSSVVSSSEESSEDSGEDSEDSDGPPEATSSKIAPPPIKVLPQPQIVQSQTERKPRKGKMCFSWEQHGQCLYGDECWYKHGPRVEKRTGLYEKLVEQELVKADGLALAAIKYLGEHGFLG